MADPLIDITPITNARQKTFTIEGVGEFTLHRPLIGDHMKIGRRVTALSGGVQQVDIDMQVLVKVQAILEILADEKPRNFVFEECADVIPFFKFWGEYGDWLDSFRPHETADTGA